MPAQWLPPREGLQKADLAGHFLAIAPVNESPLGH
jgi:hypothetical protein